MDLLAVYIGAIAVAFALILQKASVHTNESFFVPTTVSRYYGLVDSTGVPPVYPTGIVSMAASSPGTVSYQTSLAFFVTNGTLTDTVTIEIPTEVFDSVGDVVTILQAEFNAYTGPLSSDPAWPPTVTQSSGILTFNFGALDAEFAYNESSDVVLPLLGFPTVVPSSSPVAMQSIWTGTEVCSLYLYGFSASVQLSSRYTFTILVSQPRTFAIEGRGLYACYVDGKRVLAATAVTVSSTLVIQALVSTGITVTLLLDPTATLVSPVTYTTETLQYSSPGVFVVPYNAKSCYVEAVGAGASSKGYATFGGAGAVVTGYLEDLTAGRVLNIAPASVAGGASILTDDESPANLLLVAAGGGQGGSDMPGVSATNPTGASAFALHGQPGYPATVFVNGTSLPIGSTGKAGTTVGGGQGGVTGGDGGYLIGGSYLNYPIGGTGLYGGGCGGLGSYQFVNYYGGAGSGSSYLDGFTAIRTTMPLNPATAPVANKILFPGTHGNAGNLTTGPGLGFVGIQLIYNESATLVVGGAIWPEYGTYPKNTQSIAYTTATSFTPLNPLQGGCRGLYFSDGIWVAAGSGTTPLAKSSDGISWTNVATTALMEYGLCVTKGPTLWVAGGGRLGSSSLAYSLDATNWVAATNVFSGGWANAVAYGNGKYVAGGRNNTGTVFVGYSSNGISWTTSPTNKFYQSCNALLWTGTRWLAGGNGETGSGYSTILYSNDAIVWNYATNDPFADGACLGLATNGTRIVAVGFENAAAIGIAYSDNNGSTWTASSNNPFFGFCGRAVHWDGSKFLATGRNKLGTVTLASSTTGQTWTTLANVFPGSYAGDIDNPFSKFGSGIGIAQPDFGGGCALASS
jgi:hypothetical protein